MSSVPGKAKRPLKERLRREAQRIRRRFKDLEAKLRGELYLETTFIHPLTDVSRFGDPGSHLEKVRQAYGGPACQDPQVTVVVPVYNKLDFTLRCLLSIADGDERTSFEVLIVDDSSSDGTEAALSSLPGLRYSRNPENLGFIGSCNRGAEASRGEFIFFLNNDTVVTKGWLDEALRTFEEVPSVGLVASKLVYPDGRLQDAGALVWESGEAYAWGRFLDPSAPRFNFMRDIDYGCGAAILIRERLFRSLGGFDTRYRPAYYEDADLSFAVRSLGLRVLYQPLSVVIHDEGITCGTDTRTGVKAHQVVNRETFRAKWASKLAHHGSGLRDAPLAWDRRPLSRVLVIDALVPTPDRDSGSLDMFNILRILSDLGCRVSFVPSGNMAHQGRYTEALERIGIECVHQPYFRDVDHFLRSRKDAFDLVILSRVGPASRHYASVRRRCPRAKIVFHTVDLHHLRESRQAELEGSNELAKKAAETRKTELDLVHRCDATLVLSEVERGILAREVPGARLTVVPLVRDLGPATNAMPAGRRDIVFIGGFLHPPNLDAVRFFVSEVWPTLSQLRPEARFRIVGSHAPQEILSMDGQAGIKVDGFVQDLGPVLAECKVSIAPLRYGAGLKGKIASSLEAGVPCVASGVAVEGMELESESEVLIADEPEEWVRQILRLLDDESLWRKLSGSGRSFLERRFSLQANSRRFAELFRDLGLPPYQKSCSICGGGGFDAPGEAPDWGIEPSCSSCGAMAWQRALATKVPPRLPERTAASLPPGALLDWLAKRGAIAFIKDSMPEPETLDLLVLDGSMLCPTHESGHLLDWLSALREGGKAWIRQPGEPGADPPAQDGSCNELAFLLKEKGFEVYCHSMPIGEAGCLAPSLWEVSRPKTAPATAR